MASAAEEKRQAELREYYRRNPHERLRDDQSVPTQTKIAYSRASTKEKRYQAELAARKARMKNKKPTAKVNKGGMYKGKKHTYATGGVVKDMKIIRSK